MILIPYPPPREGEMAYYLKEYDGYSHGVKVRFQALAVVRDDNLVEFPRIMGPVTNYPGAQDIFIFGGFEESCDALMNYADGLREDKSLDGHIEEHVKSSDIMTRYFEAVTQANAFRKQWGRSLRNLVLNKAEIE
jgi:hypothetical protein